VGAAGVVSVLALTAEDQPLRRAIDELFSGSRSPP
jgi:hypothetical protein